MNQASDKSDQQYFLVVDDHEAILEGTLPALKNKYSTVEILAARDCQSAQYLVNLYRPHLVVVDLSIPEKAASLAQPSVGIQWLKSLMSSQLAPNLMIVSTDVKPLVRLKPMINAYEGGFAAMDKSQPIAEMLKLIDIALRGSIYLPIEVRSRPEFDRKWLEVLKLKFEEGLTDKAIAKRLEVSERTIRNYWLRIQDTLGIYDDPDKDLRLQIEIAARKMGLID